MSDLDQLRRHASFAYEEQAMIKVQFAPLDKLDPMSQDYLDKLEHIRGAVTHPLYQEESDWLRAPQGDLPSGHQAALAARFREEVERYVGAGTAA